MKFHDALNLFFTHRLARSALNRHPCIDIPWLATLITRDPGLIALVAFAARLPWLLFSIPAGVTTDRHDRKSLMVRADLFRLILTGAVIALIL